MVILMHSMSQSVHQFDPTIGLWLSPDPMADDYPGLSPFVYCAADPVNARLDSDGFIDQSIIL